MRITCTRGNEIMQRSGEYLDSRQNPDDLRFTKKTIPLNFPRQIEYANIYDVLNALQSKKLNPRDLPSLRVVSHGGQLWTLDNSLLYIYRISPKVKRVSVVYVSAQRFVHKFIGDNSKGGIEKMASAEFFPEVVNSDETPWVQLSSRRAECLRLPTSPGYKNLEKNRTLTSDSRSSTPISWSMKSASSSSKTAASRISSEDTMKTEDGPDSKGLKLTHTVRKVSTSRTASSTNSSQYSAEQTVESEKGYDSSSRSIDGHSQDFLNASVRLSESGKANITLFPLAERPSTCLASSGDSSRISRKSCTGTMRARLGKTMEALTKLEPTSAECKRQSAPGPLTVTNIFEGNVSAKSDVYVHDTEEVLEEFVLPSFCCYPLPTTSDRVVEAELDDLSSPRKPNSTEIPFEDGLDRSVSSCSSSTERPMPRPVPRNGGLQRFDEACRSPRRASVSAGQPIKCQLSTDHEFEISKKLLLKHMKKTFFSVY